MKKQLKKRNKSGYSLRKYTRSFEIKQQDKLFGDNINISEYRTYKDTGIAEYYGGVSIHPDYFGSFIDDLLNKNCQTKVEKNKTLDLKWRRNLVTISDESMSYYKTFKVTADIQNLINELQLFYLQWLMRDHQLDLLEWAGITL